jgi:coniferyl-aldehyde dehydrogenase
MNKHVILPEAAIAPIERQFQAMHAASRAEAPWNAAERRRLLRALQGAIGAHSEDFAQAISSDFGWRSHDETRMAEVLPSLTMIQHAARRVSRWMRPESRGTAVHFWPARNRVLWQPKGVVLIIVPWNYPLQLAVGPLVAALAAGNRVILKPSEFVPATSLLLKQVLEGALGAERVAVTLGGVEVAEALCRLPFDHILFTGSTGVGRQVMKAASDNLTPVTLELGGKSPALVHGDFDHGLAALRIARGKLLNAGQTCIAPDYALVRRDRVEEFVRLYKEKVALLYTRIVDNPDYTAIINAQHLKRLTDLIADARVNGSKVELIDPAGELNDGELFADGVRKMLPSVVIDPEPGAGVMAEEIFGPILPVVPYDSLEDAVAFVNKRPRPLALYVFDKDRARANMVLERTVSGDASVNDTIFHAAPEDLPFGGIGASGMGAYHGHEGFRTFSHAKGVFYQSRWSLADLVEPPYGASFKRIIRAAIRLNRR